MVKLKRLWDMLAIIMVTLSCLCTLSCSKDDKEDEEPKTNPLVGNWLYVSEEDMVCYLLTFTDKETFDYQSQKVETKISFGGTFTYNETTKKLILTPTRTSELPIEYQLKSVDDQSLIVTDEAGKILIFSRTFDSHFPLFDWKDKTPDQMLIGMWEASDSKGNIMKLSFREDGVLTGALDWEYRTRGYDWESFMGAYELDVNTMTLSTITPLDKNDDIKGFWEWTPYNKKISITETTLIMDGYTYIKSSDIPTDLCEGTLIIGAWKQTTSNGYILFTFKADGTVIRHELNGSTWEPYEELAYDFDPGKLLKIGDEYWYDENDDNSSSQLKFRHSWFKDIIILTKTDEKDMLIGGKSNLAERLEMLIGTDPDRQWTYEEVVDGKVEWIETFNFWYGANYRFYDVRSDGTKELIDAYQADYYYDYRNNRIYFKDWGNASWTGLNTYVEGAMPDYLDIHYIDRYTLVIMDGGNEVWFEAK